MSTAVFDTNVLASAFVGLTRPASTPGALMGHWYARHFDLVLSDVILGELEGALEQPYFRRRLTPMQIARDLLVLREDASFTAVTVEVHGVATHPEDDLILATAVSAQVDYLVTGDTKLQRLGVYEGVRIVSPRQFLEIVEAASQADVP